MATVNTTIYGHCDGAFGKVRDTFEQNFAERGEVGASVCLYVDGERVVDLWGGMADPHAGIEWKSDTMVVVCSSTKGMAATCMHILIDRGQLDVAAPVAKYWPEFAAAGKEAVTVRMVMSHQAGLPLWQQELPDHAFLDWNLVTQCLAEEAPVWEPGTGHGYHAMTLGFLEGEIVRRITGKSIGTFFREEIGEPLGADVWIGLPETEEHRVSDLILEEYTSHSAFIAKAMREPDWIGNRMLGNVGGDTFSAENMNSRAYHEAEAPASGGIASARGLARMYAPLSLDGSIDGIRIVSPGSLPGMRTPCSASSVDLMLRMPTQFTLGYSKSWGARSDGGGNHVIMGENAFGAPGMGGSIGFADGDARMSFGYVMNLNRRGVGLYDRGQSLVDAAYRAVGFSSSDPGFWTR